MIAALFIIILIFLGLYMLLKVPDTYAPETYASEARKTSLGKKSKTKLTADTAFYLGKDGRKNVYVPFDTAHVLACGTTGSGKTVALANFIQSGIEQDFPMLIVDGKGDIGAGSLFDIVKKLKGNKKLYVINLNSPQESDTYNPFQNTSPTVIKDMLINLTEWSEAHYKVNAERYLQKVVDLMRLDGQELSFKSIVAHMPVSTFQLMAAGLFKKEVISKEEQLALNDIAEQSGKIAQSSIARFSSIIENELGGIFDEAGVDIYTALEEKAIILFILNPLTYPELSPLIGNLVIIDAKKAVSNLYGGDLGRVLFLFDEINVYASKNFLDLINKSRSGGITCVLATQSLSDLDASTSTGEYFKEQVIENCNNYIILRQNSAANADQWANIIGTKETMAFTHQIDGEGGTNKGSARLVREYVFHPDEIKQLGTGEAFYISKDNKITCRVSIHKPY